MVARKGRLKWFSDQKGYGFVVLEDGAEALLPAAAVRKFGPVLPHSIVYGDVETGPKGLFVTAITKCELSPATCEAGYIRVKIKWYDCAKGFGFATHGEGNPDIFVHAEALKASGISEAHEGQEFMVRIIQTDNGLKAQDVRTIT